MACVNKIAEVPYSAEKMFDLVNDVRAYPEFLPWCVESEVLSENEDEVRATLHLAKGGLRKAFTTCNRLQQGKMIEVRLVSGPFRHLEGFWRFEALGETNSRVSLDLEFEFANPLISMAIGPVFQPIAASLVDSFVTRAHQLYGNK